MHNHFADSRSVESCWRQRQRAAGTGNSDQTPAYDLTEPEPVPDSDLDQSAGA